MTEIYLCHACSCQEIVSRNGRGQPSVGVQADDDGDGVAEEEAEVVAVAESECGLRLGALAYAVFSLRGLDPDSLVWPADRSTEEPLFVGDNGKRMASSSGGRSASMLNRTRAILLRMQLEGQEPELLDLAVAKISSYCWKISGTTAMISQGKDKALITGQGRWGLYVRRPSEMVEYYRQAPLDEKLDTTDLKPEAKREQKKLK